jgi:hypothetical protein
MLLRRLGAPLRVERPSGQRVERPSGQRVETLFPARTT